MRRAPRCSRGIKRRVSARGSLVIAAAGTADSRAVRRALCTARYGALHGIPTPSARSRAALYWTPPQRVPGLLVAAGTVLSAQHGVASVDALNRAVAVRTQAAVCLLPLLVAPQLLASAARGVVVATAACGPVEPLRCSGRDEGATDAVVVPLAAAGTEAHGAGGAADALARAAGESDILGTVGGRAGEEIGGAGEEEDSVDVGESIKLRSASKELVDIRRRK